MILRINPVRYWNFVSQTDANEQEKIDFTSEFLNSFILVTQSVSRVTKKMKFFKSLLRMILRINPVRNWNFISQTDANEQEKPVFTSEFLKSFSSLSRIRFRAWQRRWIAYYVWSRILIRFEIEILLVKPMSVNKKSLFLRRNFSILSSQSRNRLCAWQRRWNFLNR